MEIQKLIIGKVRSIGDGMIFDEDENHIADARGWGRYQYMDDGEKIHDEVTNFIVDAINEKLDRQKFGISPRAIVIRNPTKDNILILGDEPRERLMAFMNHIAPVEVKEEIEITLPIIDFTTEVEIKKEYKPSRRAQKKTKRQRFNQRSQKNNNHYS